MSAGGLAAAWAALVATGAWRLRPPPSRLRALVARPLRPPHPPMLERAGARVLLRAGRPVDPVMARQVGTAIAFALAAAPAATAAVPFAAVVGWALPRVRARREERARLAALARDLPDVVDLLALAVGAGLTVPPALAAVARRAPGPLAAELGRALDEVRVGRRLADALDDVPARAGEATRPLVAALVASERYGAPVAEGLARLADDVRRDRRRCAEEAARRVPVKLLFPLVTCVLPAFALLTVAPLLAGALRSLRL